MAAMYGGGGGKAARAEKREAKKELKETRQMIKAVSARTPAVRKAERVIDKRVRANEKENKSFMKAAEKEYKSSLKSSPKPAKEKGISLKERADKLSQAKGLAKLDVLEIPLKPSARRQMFRNQRKGK